MDCPNEATLRDFLRGALAAEFSDEVVVHIDHCAECEAVVQRLEREPDTVLDPLAPAYRQAMAMEGSRPVDSELRERWQALAGDSNRKRTTIKAR